MSDEQEAEVADEEADQEADEQVETEETEETEQTEPESGLQEGDFVRLAYTARTVEGGQLVDTTDQEVAEEEGVDQEDREFEPRVLALGAGHIFEGVEEDIYGKEPGDSGTVTITQAFGEYDQDEVRTVSAEKISEDDRYPGAQVNIDGQQGYVETIIGGRARVDFNHPLAGEDVEYEYEIVEEVDDKLERARGLLGMYFEVGDIDMRLETDEVEEEVQVETDDEDEEPEFETETVEKESLYIEATPQLTMNQQWMFQKQQIGQELIDRLDIDRIVVEDVIDGSGMGGMFGGMPGMGGMGGGDIEEALEDADIDEDEIVEELEADEEFEAAEDEAEETEE